MADEQELRRTRQKALELNLDQLFYGSIAEIGAGQEVARNFFQAGGASGTVAKTLSAYDMQFSDAIYGPESSGRYVTRGRLEAMLDTEYDLLIDRVASSRPEGTRFFAFADTVAAKSYQSDRPGHGWVGVKFQHCPDVQPSRVMIHIRMLDSSNRGQQEALGIFGVNLLWAIYTLGDDIEALVDSLQESLAWGRIEVDWIHLEGPCFGDVDNRLLNLRIVSSSLGPVVMFGPDGEAVLPWDATNRKDVMILRGSFRPFTDVHRAMLEIGLSSMAEELDETEQDIVTFCEMNIARELNDGVDESSDLLERVESITSMGYNVMVSSHLRYFRLSEYFSKDVKRKIGFLMSVDNLYTIFDDRYYDGMEGGILEAMGKLFASDSGLLVYPILTPEGDVLTVDNIELPDSRRHLYHHLLVNGRIIGLHPERSTLVPFDR